jgi:uncharacterized membrane protein
MREGRPGDSAGIGTPGESIATKSDAAVTAAWRRDDRARPDGGQRSVGPASGRPRRGRGGSLGANRYPSHRGAAQPHGLGADMAWLVVGLVIFLGMHSSRVFAEAARGRFIAQRGEMAWKGLYSVVSLAGLVLIVVGYGAARSGEPVFLWSPPVAMRHVASLLTLVAFVLLAAAYVPRNVIKARLHHPMVLGVKTWAFAHLVANQFLHDVLLFGGFLVWAVLSFRAARQRDRAAGTVYPAGTAAATVAVVVIGIVAWAMFAFWAHGLLFGVRPFGR